ncbi:SAM-dependent methyltransferase [Rubinisphaera margarita]|uniref:SAM-dependent methyltransferase n=1 Tax=Rubinisphaera margarita TaxID=2909586 RepID=UPI001EE85EFF|nr:cyclopropane-fatty-acyl-phospholipid synthase family protein [Rubinisphaera margarita]MCG6155205.1 cyclopropane-fatty-acyl-phospholipid synthase family protein [Rubinisphaera margarita]
MTTTEALVETVPREAIPCDFCGDGPEVSAGPRLSLTDRLFGVGLNLAEQGVVPDVLIRRAIRRLLSARLAEREEGTCADHQERIEWFIASACSGPIADVPEKANEQHYEVPAEFFARALGPRKKYSCCYYPDAKTSLRTAEEEALRLTCTQAELADGQQVLELGCGWGSLSLWMAEHFPGSQITAVSNSRSQKAFIDECATERGLLNLHVVTADMNEFAPTETFDRVVSVEMFEHMRNHRLLLRRISEWLNPDGKLYVHIFCHRAHPYLFSAAGPQDWMSEHFFSGGMMPSDELFLHYQEDLICERRWRWNGQHYQRTCEDWLLQTDAARDQVLTLFRECYGPEQARSWLQRWRIFFMACAELFGYNDGNEWWVSHYRFSKRT